MFGTTCTYHVFNICFVCLLMNRPQGSRKLPNLGGQIIMWGAQLIKTGLTDLPKPGWTIAHPAHPSPTPLDHVTRVTRFSAQGRNHGGNFDETYAMVGRICPPWWG